MTAPSGPPPRPETRVESETEIREALHALEIEPAAPPGAPREPEAEIGGALPPRGHRPGPPAGPPVPPPPTPAGADPGRLRRRQADRRGRPHPRPAVRHRPDRGRPAPGGRRAGVRPA